MTALSAQGFVLKGWHVLAMLLLFFGTVFSVNFYMARVAIQTFSGLEAEKPYQEGLKYNNEIAFAREQSARGWSVSAQVMPQADGVMLDIVQRDKLGVATPDLSISATFIHPADRRRDVKVDVMRVDAGHYRVSVPVSAGRWDLQIEATQGETPLFRSVNRIEIAPVT